MKESGWGSPDLTDSGHGITTQGVHMKTQMTKPVAGCGRSRGSAHWLNPSQCIRQHIAKFRLLPDCGRSGMPSVAAQPQRTETTVTAGGLC